MKLEIDGPPGYFDENYLNGHQPVGMSPAGDHMHQDLPFDISYQSTMPPGYTVGPSPVPVSAPYPLNTAYDTYTVCSMPPYLDYNSMAQQHHPPQQFVDPVGIAWNQNAARY